LETIVSELNIKVNKLWCESTTNPVPILFIVASRGFSVMSSHGHSTPSLKVSCKPVQPFSRNLADKETKKEINKDINKDINKEINQKQYPGPQSIRDGVMKLFQACLG